jgi:hypothetical protein
MYFYFTENNNSFESILTKEKKYDNNNNKLDEIIVNFSKKIYFQEDDNAYLLSKDGYLRTEKYDEIELLLKIEEDINSVYILTFYGYPKIYDCCSDDYKSKYIFKTFDDCIEKIKKHLDKIHDDENNCNCIDVICKSVINSFEYFAFKRDDICMKHFRYYDYSDIGYTIQQFSK